MFEQFEIDEEFLKIDKDQFKKFDDYKVIYLFGKNGSGKTTISREIKKLSPNLKLFVFNKDYINKNVYIEKYENELTQSKPNTNNKKNTAKIFLGEKLVNFNIDINKNTQENMEEKKFFDNDKEKNPIYQKEKLESSYKVDFSNEIKRDAFLNREDDFYLILEEKKLEIESLNNNIEFQKKVELFNFIIDNIREQNKNFEEFNKIFSTTETATNKIIQLHELASKYCENNEIRFLDKPYKKDLIDEWLVNNTNQKSNLINEINKTKNIIKNKIEDFKNKGINFKNEKFKEKEKIINDILEINNKKFEENIELKYNFNSYEKWEYSYELNLTHIKKWVELNKLFIIFNNNYDDTCKKLYSIIEKEKIIRELIKDKKKEIDKISSNFTSDINNFIIQIANDNFDLKIKFKESGNETELEIFSETKKIANLSEGEKNTLALAYFFSELKYNQEIDRDFIIFIDDPFDSNDHFKYDNLPNIKINKNDNKSGLSSFLKKLEDENNKEGLLIITTHNIHVLSAFMRSIVKDNIEENQCFKEIEKFAEKFIGLFTIIKDNNSKISELNKKLFFPIESNLRNKIKKIWKFFELKNKECKNINDKDLQIFILLSSLLTKLFDDGIQECENINDKDLQIFILLSSLLSKSLDDSINDFDNDRYPDSINDFDNDRYPKRQDIKEYIKPFQSKISSLSNKILKEKCREVKIDFNFDEDDLKLFLIKYLYQSNEADNLLLEKDDLLVVEYLHFIKDRYSKVLNSNDPEKLRRIRHKNNIYSTPIGHIIEEF